MYRVLIADDESIIREGIKCLFDWESLGYTIAGEAANGETAYQQILALQPDIVLLDIRMPGMDGLEEARCIRALERSDAKTVPIIAVTANLFQQDISACSNAGMTGFLSKPLNVEQLLTMIAQQTRKGEQSHE